MTLESTGLKPSGIFDTGGRPSLSNLLLYFFRSYARAGLGVAPNKPEANPTAPILAALRRDTHPKTPSELTASREEARDAGPGRTNAVAETRRHPPSHKVVLIGSRTLSALRDLDPNPSGLALPSSGLSGLESRRP